MADKFEDLRNYVAVVDRGGVNAAAAALGIAKSAVSRRLGELEARLGFTLIERTTRRFELTALGRDYHRRAVAILASLDELDRHPGDLATEETTVTICAEESLCPRLLAPLLAAYCALNSGLRIVLMVTSPHRIEHEIDLRISTGPARGNGRESRTLGTFAWTLSAAPAYLAAHGVPTSSADLSSHRRILVAGAEEWWLGGNGTRMPTTVLVVPDDETAAAAAVAAGGFVMLPAFTVREAVSRGELQSILDDQMDRSEITATYDVECNATIKMLVDHLATSFRTGA